MAGARSGARPDLRDTARLALAGALALVAVWPAMYLLAAALPVLGAGGWLAHFAATAMPHQMLTSVWVALEATAVAFAVGAVPAVATAWHEFRGRRLVIALSLLPLLFAPFVGAGTWTVPFSSKWVEGPHALAVLLGLACAPYVFVIFHVAAARMPRSYGEVAAALGQGPLARLRRVHAPLLAVPAAASLMIVFAMAVGDYAAAERVGVDTLSVGIHNLWLSTQSSEVAAIVSTVLIVPTVLFVIVGAWVSTSIISQNPVPPAAAAAARRPLPAGAAAVLTGWVLLCSLPAFWIPEAITLRWAWLKWGRTNFKAIPTDLLQTAATAALTAALVGVVCVATALLLRAGARSRMAERMPWLFLANFFLPSLVLALAFVMMSRDGSAGATLLGEARDTRLLIVVADALRFMPLAMLPMLDALRRTPPAMIEAAQVFGAGPWRARWVAFSGHVRPALVLGCALVFMETLKELDLSLMLQPFGYSSTSLKIYAFSRHQNMDRGAIWVLLTQALMLVPLGLLYRRLVPRTNRAPTADGGR